ncbi:F-box protein At5g49610-like [Rhododendron vialii]|uniref:F-box protein At5g49610-like n=1 Tax=Rhododendron vialii TaxID=182163 RepID=UPI00265D8904|nr:F-box protein At5g49610-like [Rhododendron vialii]
MAKKAMAIVDELPEGVLMDILSRIQSKSLLRFKSVSKYWYSLIQNPSFISLHHNLTQHYDCILFQPTDDECCIYLFPNETSIEELDISFTRPHLEKYYLGGSCNGLICLFDKSTIIICNPAMREFRLLPQPFYGTLRISTDSWKEIIATVPKNYITKCPSPCTSLDEVFYWLCGDLATDAKVIGALNTIKESFEQISLSASICK